MFLKTRKRLTILYTGLTMIFLLSFIIITYIWLTESITKDQKQAVMTLAKIELAEHKQDLMDWYKEGMLEKEDENEYEHEDSRTHDFENRMFYYVMSKDGTLVDAAITRADLYKDVYTRLQGWKPENLEVRYETFKDNDGEKVVLLLAGISVYESDEFIGTIYTGTNVSGQQEVLQRLLTVLIILLIVFLLLALFLSYFMAGKAMIPISRTLQRQKEFVSDASHELRTPLSVMQSSIEVIEAEEKDRLSEFSNQVLIDMKEEVKRMTKLVADLLTLARSDSGTLELKAERFNVVEVMTHLIRSLKPFASKFNITLSLETSEQVIINADQERITQLLYILIDNAIKYNVPHGKVLLRAKEQAKSIQIEIEDTGIGIADEQKKRIFDRFYRIDKARSRDLGSNGIGLSIAEWIVHAHNGEIEVMSQEGKGSTFIVKLPLEQEKRSH